MVFPLLVNAHISTRLRVNQIYFRSSSPEDRQESVARRRGYVANFMNPFTYLTEGGAFVIISDLEG